MDEPRGAVPPGAGVLGAHDFGNRLERWIAEARTADAAAARSRARWLRVQAEESSTLLGVLVDLAERASPVVLHGRAGRRHRGVVTIVGEDFCAVRTDANLDVFLAYHAISSIRPDTRGPAPTGHRSVQADVDLVRFLSTVAADRPRVLIVTTVDEDGIAGELRSVGRDVVALRLDGPDRASAYVAIPVIAEVSLVTPEIA